MLMTKRYTKEEVVNNRFYQMPKFLFESEFKELSNDARVLYALLRDRHELSLSNEWVNDAGEVYFIFSRENMGEVLGLSGKTVTKAMNDLKKHNLIEEERQGQGKPNLIFLRVVSIASTKTRKISPSESVEFTHLNKENLRPNDTDIIYTENNQLVSLKDFKHASPYRKPTEEELEIGMKIIKNQAQVYLYDDDEFKDMLIETIRNCYIKSETRPIIIKLKVEHIDVAKKVYTEAQKDKDIKNPILYFERCLISAIVENGLKKLF
jgi:DNA-binding transcriptional ArsR family regulator